MRKALTIGELLVTMTIIGVIATLVLPGFLKDYHKKIYVTKLKKTYEMLDSAVNQACADNNVSYLSQTKYSVSNKDYQQEFLDKYFKTTAAKTNPFSSEYKKLSSGDVGTVSLVANHGWAKLASGEAVSYYCGSDDYCVFRVDINSTDGPNIGGRDFFALFINKKTNKIYDEYEENNCGANVYGEGCFAKILKDNWTMEY